METTESDVGYPEEQPPEVDDTPAEGTPQRKAAKAARQKTVTTTTARPPAIRRLRRASQLERQHREVVARRRAVAERARDEALDEPDRPVHRRRPHRGRQLLGAPHRVRRARLGQPVGVEHERVAGPQVGAAVLQLRVGQQPEQRARRADLLDARRRRAAAPAADARRRRPSRRAGERARSTCAQAIVQKRPPAASWSSIASPTQRRIAAGERRRAAAVRSV